MERLERLVYFRETLPFDRVAQRFRAGLLWRRRVPGQRDRALRHVLKSRCLRRRRGQLRLEECARFLYEATCGWQPIFPELPTAPVTLVLTLPSLECRDLFVGWCFVLHLRLVRRLYERQFRQQVRAPGS